MLKLGCIIIIGLGVSVLLGIVYGRYMVNNYEPDYDDCKRMLGMIEED